MTSKPNWYKDLKTLPFQETGFNEHFRYSVLQRIHSKKTNRINKYILYPVMSITAIAVCVIMFFQISPTEFNFKEPNEGFRYVAATLNEEMWHVDAIVLGEVLDAENSEILDQSILPKKNYLVDITPAVIQVNDVLYGDVQTSTITLLQHGNAVDQNASLVTSGEELFLILVRTTSGEYWAYDPNNGIWTITDGKVFATNPIAPMDKLNGADVNKFKEQITKAAQNKKKPVGMKYENSRS